MTDHNEKWVWIFQLLWQIKTTNHRLEKHRFGKMVVPKFFFGVFLAGGTTLHSIALSFKDMAVISWTPSSYLTQFHLVVQVSYSMCASALLKRTSSCWDTRKLNQVIMGNTRKLNQVKLKINHRRHLMHVATNPKLKTRFSAKLKNESQKVDSNGMAALTSFSTAGVKSHAWVFDATRWRLTLGVSRRN